MIVKKEDPFFVHLDEVPKPGLAVTETLDGDWAAPLLGPAYQATGKGVTIHFEARRDGESLVVKGTVDVPVRFACSRCAEDTESSVTCTVNALFVPAHSTRLHLDDVDLGSDDELDELFPFQGRSFSIEQAFVDAVAFALQPYPVCRPDCSGVKNAPLVTTDEELQADDKPAVDPRWAALAEMKKKLERK